MKQVHFHIFAPESGVTYFVLQPTKEADTDRSGQAGRGGGREIVFKTLMDPVSAALACL